MAIWLLSVEQAPDSTELHEIASAKYGARPAFQRPRFPAFVQVPAVEM